MVSPVSEHLIKNNNILVYFMWRCSGVVVSPLDFQTYFWLEEQTVGGSKLGWSLDKFVVLFSLRQETLHHNKELKHRYS